MSHHTPIAAGAPSGKVGLRAARTAAGWSQTEAAIALVTLARRRGVPVAAPASLKTQLSRWENGHALPDPPYRDLLAELYGRTPADLGLAAGADARPGAGQDGAIRDGPDRLRAAVAEAAAAGRAGPQLWWEQLAAARRLDDELGAAGAEGLVDAQIEQLSEIVLHTLHPDRRAELAAVLAAAAALGAAQSLDRGRHDLAWRRYDRSLSAARAADAPLAAALAIAGQAEVLVDAGEPGAAVELLGHTDAGTDRAAAIRLTVAAALAGAAAGDRAATTEAMAAAERQWLARPPDTGRPPDGTPIELADLHRWHGRALVELGDGEAVDRLDRALAETQRSARNLAAVHADLALALRADRPDSAAEHAATARELATSIGSHRIAARLSGPAAAGRRTS